MKPAGDDGTASDDRTFHLLMVGSASAETPTLEAALKEAGLSRPAVVRVPGCAEAVREARSGQFDMLLVQTANQDETLGIIRELRETCPDTTLFVIAEEDNAVFVAATLEAGATHCLSTGHVKAGLLPRVIRRVQDHQLAKHAIGQTQYRLEQEILQRKTELVEMTRQFEQEIAARKQTEEELRRSKELYQILIEAQMELVAKIAPDGTLLYVSPAYCETFGKSEADLLGKPFEPLIHEDDRKISRQAWDEVFQDPFNTYVELRELTASGWRWQAWRSKAVRDDRGTVTSVVAVGRDITQRKFAEMALRESEDRFRQLAESAFEGILFQENGIILEVNGLLCRMLGYTPEEMIDQHVLNFVAPEFHELVVKNSATGYEKVYEIVAVRKDGSTFPAEIMGRSVNWRGRQARVAAVRDITERNAADKALRESEERFRLLVESVPASVTITGQKSGEIRYANRAASNIYGVPREDMVGRATTELFLSTEERRHLMRQMATEGVVSDHIQRARRPDGEEISMLLSMQPTLWKGEAAILAVGQDVTARQAAEEALKQKTAELEAIFAAIPDLYFRMNPEGAILDYKAGTEHDLYVPPEQFLGKRMVDVLPPDIGIPLSEATHRAYREKRLITCEYCLPKDGQPLYFEARLVPLGSDEVITLVRNITESKIVQQSLQFSEAKYRNLVERLQEGIWVADADHVTTFVNPSMAEMLGYSVEEMIGESVFAFMGPSQEKVSRPRLDSHPSQSDGQIDVEFLRKDGSSLNATLVTASMTDENGHFTGTIAGVMDNTERLRAERKLRISEERLNTGMNAANVGMWDWDLVQNKAQYSPTWYTVLGYEPYELPEATETWDALLHPDDLPRVYSEVNDVWEKKKPGLEYEFRMKAKDGSYRWLLSRGKVVQWTEDGKPARMIGTHTDITSMRENADRLREQAALLDLAHDAIIVCDLQDRILFWSSGAEEMYGWTKAEALGRISPELLRTQFPVPRKDVYEILRREGRYLCELEQTRKDGKVLTVAARWAAQRNEQGEAVRILMIHFDVTERKLAEDVIRRHGENLEREVQERTAKIIELEHRQVEFERLAANGRMAARIAHEINNPLAGVKNSFLLVKSGIPRDFKYYDYVGRIEKEIDRIAWIVRQMFALQRPDHIATRHCKVAEVVRDVVAMVRSNPRAQGLGFVTNLAKAERIVRLNEDSLRQVLFNLIQNAVEVSPPKGEIEIRAVSNNDVVTVTVSDHGPGIPKELQKRVFEPFFTTKSGKETGGLGLGLSISQGLVMAMGGQLVFKCPPAGGTTFQLSLPLKNLDQENQHA